VSHGGARPGAGRPKLPAHVLEQLRAVQMDIRLEQRKNLDLLRQVRDDATKETELRVKCALELMDRGGLGKNRETFSEDEDDARDRASVLDPALVQAAVEAVLLMAAGRVQAIDEPYEADVVTGAGPDQTH
jgi:hypothetical protein